MPHAAGLYYEAHGPADAEPLILSSGLGGSASYWAPNLAALAAQYRVIAYDHRGTGRSDRALPETVSVDDLADDILALMDALDIDWAHVMGHAAGAVAGLALALKAPDRIESLAMINGWARPDPHFLRCFEARLALLRGTGPEAYLRAQPIFLYPANWISEHSDELDAETAVHLAHFPGAATMEKRIAALAGFDVEARLGEVDIPVLALAAEDDMLVPSIAAGRLYDGLADCTELLMPWGGHACNVTDPDNFNRLILAWLAGDDLPEE
jgi:aminoacrylate hydrolase